MISPSLTPEECAVIRYALERAEQPPPHWPHVQTAFNKLAEAAKAHEDDMILAKAKEIEAAQKEPA